MAIRSRTLSIPLLALCLILAGSAAPRGAQPVAAQPAPAEDCSAGLCTFLPLLSVAPIVPSLNAPYDDEHVESIAPILTWTPAITGTEYMIQIDDSPDFLPPLVLDTSKRFKAPTSDIQSSVPRANLEGATKYYWRVGVHLPEGDNFAPTLQFTTAPYDPARLPFPPQQLAPRNGARVTTPTPTLSWQAVPGANYYRIKLINPDGTTFRTTSALDAPATSYVATGLAARTAYKWQIRVHTNYGWSDYGPLSSFITP